jgi:hypothetical protein
MILAEISYAMQQCHHTQLSPIMQCTTGQKCQSMLWALMQVTICRHSLLN